jgi:hypothetical protein
MTVLAAGGWGQVAWGQHQYGAPASDIEPRFYASYPADGAYNRSRESVLEYQVYYHSSFPAELLLGTVLFEISENGGGAYSDAQVSPYALTYRFLGGHTLWVKIVKSGLWARDSEIVVRTTCEDEFGQTITKEFPIRWD